MSLVLKFLLAVVVVNIGVRVLKAVLPDMGKRPFTWMRTRLGWGLGTAELARRLDVAEEELRGLQPYYRAHRIPKRSGGTRRLLVPDDATKELQRRILRRLLARLRAHPSACGFETGKSILDNARPHVGRAVVVKMDVEDFFPTTTDARIDAYFRRVGWNGEAAALLTRLTTSAGGLPQGAPTSPRLANLVNFQLDARLARRAKRFKGAYTRYADDITFSFPRDYPRKVRGTIQITRQTLRALGYRMHARKKLSIRRRHQRQLVTGLVVNEKVQLPRETRRWLRAVRHHVATGRPTTLTETQLQGWLAFAAMVENGVDP